MRIATGEEPDGREDASPAAQLGKLGGEAPAKALTKEQRQEIARKEATKRWLTKTQHSGPRFRDQYRDVAEPAEPVVRAAWNARRTSLPKHAKVTRVIVSSRSRNAWVVPMAMRAASGTG